MRSATTLSWMLPQSISMTSVVTSLAGCMLLLLWGKKRYERSVLPPGPKGWPIVGNILSINFSNPTPQFMSWAQEFGGIFTLNMLGQHVVVVCSKEAMTEVLVTKSDDFANRPYVYRMRELTKYNDIVTSPISPQWIQLKKHSITALKICGEGLPRFEEITLEIIQDLLSTLSAKTDKSFDILPDIHNSVTDVICSLIYGKRIDICHIKEWFAIDAQFASTIALAGSGSELDAFPLLRFIPFNPNKKKLDKLSDTIWRWVLGRAHMYKDVEDLDAHDGAVHTLKKRQKTADGKLVYTDNDIDAVINNYMVAGTVTTVTSLYSLVLLLINHPDIQNKARTEIDNVIAARSPSLADRSKCHFVEAMLMELLRYISHIPFGIPHETRRATTLMGYRMPKGTQIWTDFYSLHHDLNIWEKPWEFIPERFLDGNNELIAVDHPLRKQWFPFGAGRRACLGEQLARNRLFLFTASLLQRFNFLPPDGDTIPSPDVRDFKFGIITSPEKYQIKVLLRD